MVEELENDLLREQAESYSEDDIKTLQGLEHIRQRPGMYIGRLGDGSHQDDGIYVLFKEVLDNAIDEYVMGYGRRIDVAIEENTFTIRDYGRGIPPGKLVDCVSNINTGGKFNSDKYQFTVGMNGVGTKAVNALSSRFVAESIRSGKGKRATFKYGKLQSVEDFDTEERNGTRISFTPDPEKFVNYKIKIEFVERRLWMYAYLNSGLSLYLNNQRYYSKNGLQDLLSNEIEAEAELYSTIHYKDERIEFAFCHAAESGEKYFSFVNGQYTSDGGTHLSAFKGGLLRAVNEHFSSEFDARDLRDGIIGAVAVKVKEPVFESQTKNKLGNTDVKSWIENTVKTAVIDYLLKNPPEAEKLLEKVKRNEDLRKAFNKIKSNTKEMTKSLSLRNSKLKDCKHHFGDRSKFADETMIFLVEGDSAGGSLVQSRDPEYQAVFSLRGKPLNCYGKQLIDVYDNKEFFYITKTLNIDEDLENLRYAKVIIASDADVDGLHIRNLLITFFLSYFESLVMSGHLYILETPLFRVRNKKVTHYCYSEEERDAMAAKLGKGAEITRFKGLGEISADEFKQFIGEDIRLEKVTIENSKGIPEMLKFYMGDNTPERWEHIVENLV
ncbi:MAG: type IIA DNA topoisomerase subunit B [Lentisphaerae bacterium]|nr:type IIA DNA topoisomerase subunit B [Lentisphaerota bacterium]MBR4884560.1 type IIA DNA topoisomerase subunit B [Lentisphaeria bacterium]